MESCFNFSHFPHLTTSSFMQNFLQKKIGDPIQKSSDNTREFVTWCDFCIYTPDKESKITTKELDNSENKSMCWYF